MTRMFNFTASIFYFRQNAVHIVSIARNEFLSRNEAHVCIILNKRVDFCDEYSNVSGCSVELLYERHSMIIRNNKYLTHCRLMSKACFQTVQIIRTG